MQLRLVLVACACVAGCARPGGDSRQPGAQEAGTIAARPSDDDFEDASPKGARAISEKPGGEPIAFLRGRRVILKPRRVAFQIPQPWLDRYDSPPTDRFEALRKQGIDTSGLTGDLSPRNNLHFTRKELDQVQTAAGDEWDVTFATAVNSLITFDKCVFHGGGEGWGEQGTSFADLQMRVYLGLWDLAEVQKAVSENGLAAVKKLSQDAFARLRSRSARLKGFTDMTGGASPGASWKHTTFAGWQVDSLTFPMTFYDYGATAVIDFYAKKIERTSAVLVFMYTTFKGSQQAEMREVVESFTMSPLP